ncbi:ABC transporter permease [Gemella cuniculi]|uniref:ABC transporter permease n=1 Tax=Gemella cuniculi TaxID=150240 RepID=UPI0003F98B51|nr:ABC transporter permease subunit [Gemella cuniculi]
MIKKFLEVIVIIAFIILFSQMILWAFVEDWLYPNIFPNKISLRMWDTALSIKELKVLGFSVLLSVVVTILTIVISYPIAKVLALYKIKYKGIIRFILIIPFLIPMTSISMGIHLAFIKIGLANNVTGIILLELFTCVPYAVLGLEPILKIIGKDIEEQAQSLGANIFNIIIKVTLPLISPGLMVTSILVFLVSMSQYFIVSLIGGGIIKTYPLIMFPYIYAKDRHIASIYGLIFLGTCLLVIFVFRTLVSRMYKEKLWKY